MTVALARVLLAEAAATAVLVFFGTGAMVVDARWHALGNVGIAIAFALAVVALVHVFGPVSGGHANPAVTIGLWLGRRFPGRRVAPYCLAQCAGGLAASALLVLLLPTPGDLGATVPKIALAQVFAWEVVMTGLLMLVVLRVASADGRLDSIAGAIVGGTVGLAALVGGPLCNASLNPARSLAPALVSGTTAHLWLYLVAPPVGAALAVGLWRLIHGCPATATKAQHA